MREYSIAMEERLSSQLEQFLIRPDRQEDLTFALWTPSVGEQRLTALLHTVLLPGPGDRNVHGNVSFNSEYFERAVAEAMRSESGLAFLHSHPFPGWQGMSHDDVVAEEKMAGAVAGLTGLPLIGLTVGSNTTWSGRFWNYQNGRNYRRDWATSVRTAGSGLGVDFANDLLPPPMPRELFRRTISVWSAEAHANLARLRIGIVGLGSVGSMVAESLARMGFQRFVLLDFDRIRPHNLDRLVCATEADIGRLKVEVAEERIRKVATAGSVDIRSLPYSVVEEAGYRGALDCDVIFSCVDRPRGRSVLNHIAYAHLIPVIDGGIQVRFRFGRFSGVDWQLQTASPGRPCLECVGAYNAGDASTEEAGLLDDPSYMDGLPKDHALKQNENVFPFSTNLASLEVLQLVALVTGAAGVTDFGIQRFRYLPGILEQIGPDECKLKCGRSALVAQGDRYFTLVGRDAGAEKCRADERLVDLIGADEHA